MIIFVPDETRIGRELKLLFLDIWQEVSLKEKFDEFPDKTMIGELAVQCNVVAELEQWSGATLISR